MTADVPATTAPVSPLAGYADRFAAAKTATGGQVRLTEVPFLAQVSLRAGVGPRGETDNSGIDAVLGCVLPLPGQTSGEWPLVLSLGPDEWLILSSPGTQAGLEERLRAAGCDAVTDVSGQRTTITLTGPRSRELLAKGCALDLHPKAFRDDSCAQTLLAQAQVLLLPAPGDPGGGDGFWILPRSSYARYVADWLLDAAREWR